MFPRFTSYGITVHCDIWPPFQRQRCILSAYGREVWQEYVLCTDGQGDLWDAVQGLVPHDRNPSRMWLAHSCVSHADGQLFSVSMHLTPSPIYSVILHSEYLGIPQTSPVTLSMWWYLGIITYKASRRQWHTP